MSMGTALFIYMTKENSYTLNIESGEFDLELDIPRDSILESLAVTEFPALFRLTKSGDEIELSTLPVSLMTCQAPEMYDSLYPVGDHPPEDCSEPTSFD